MSWDADVADMIADNVDAFGVDVTVKHVTARAYVTATGKNGRTESSTTVKAIRGEEFFVSSAPAGCESVGRVYTFVFDAANAVLSGQSFSIDREDRIVDGPDTWLVSGVPVRTGNGRGLEVRCCRMKVTTS